jgi:hypothetical protein
MEKYIDQMCMERFQSSSIHKIKQVCMDYFTDDDFGSINKKRSMPKFWHSRAG